MLNKRALPSRLIDAWGNMRRRDQLTTQTCANIHLRTAHNTEDIDLHQGIGKPLSVPVVKEGTIEHRGAFTAPVPRMAMPPRVIGHTGHLRGAQAHVGIGYNTILMELNPSYANATNYLTNRTMADKVPVIPV